jgi:hypothetical protein
MASNLRTIVQALTDMGPLFEEPMRDLIQEENEANADISNPVANLLSLFLFIYHKCDRTAADGIANALLQTLLEVQDLHS